MAGAFMARGLSERVAFLENTAALLGQMSDRLRYLQPDMYSLIESMGRSERFSGLLFPGRCLGLMDKGLSFPESWRLALEEAPGALENEESEMLSGLSEVLGCTDLDTQLAQLAFAGDRLLARLEAARDRERKYAKLYRSLGALGGLALVIMLI